MFNWLWLQLVVVAVVTKATLEALNPSKQLPRFRHGYNMSQCCRNLYLVNPISKFRITKQGIQLYV
jgi:hypothetical protein